MSSASSQTKGGKPFWKWSPESTGIPDIPKEVKEAVVLHLRLVTHSMGAPRSKNHWTFFLVISNTGSVQVNFRQGDEGEEDVMVIAVRSYITSNSAIQDWDYESIGSPKVQAFFQSIIDNKRYLFDFNSEGTGCRDWVLTTITDFQRLQLIKEKDNRSSKEVSEVIPFEYSKTKPPKACPVDRGVWLAPKQTQQSSSSVGRASQPASGGFTKLKKGEYRQEGQDVIIRYQGQWVKVPAKDLSVDKASRRISIPKLQVLIEY